MQWVFVSLDLIGAGSVVAAVTSGIFFWQFVRQMKGLLATRLALVFHIGCVPSRRSMAAENGGLRTRLELLSIEITLGSDGDWRRHNAQWSHK